jgi:signal transduction histidine kinase
LSTTKFGLWVSPGTSPSKSRERELRRQNERLGELTNIVSHDLWNPLNVADGRIELARETGPSDQLVRASDVIDRCQELVDDLLVMAEGGSEVSEMASVKIADAAERAWQTVQAGPATLEVDSSRRIRADSSRLRQLLEDLYRNSVEHGGDDVTVRVGDVAGGFYVSGPGSSSPVSSVSCDTYSRRNVFITAPI